MNTSPNDDFVRFITEALENDSAALANEEKVVIRTIAWFDMKESENAADVQDFLKHYNSGKGLDEKEQEWALEMFDKLHLDNVDFGNFMAGGAQLFTPEELANGDQRNMKIDVIANALMGNEVILKEDGRETLVSENIDVPEAKNWLEKFIDLIKEMLGIGSNEKQRTKLVKAVEENFSEKKSSRISYEELSGLNALNKVTGQTQRHTECTVGMGGRTN